MTSLRDTSVQFPEHALFRGFTWRAWLNESGKLDVRLPQTSVDGTPPGLWTGSLNSASDDASIYQGFARTNKIELCDDPNWSNYVPFIERFGDDQYAIEGVRARIGATYFTGSAATGWWTGQNEFAEPTFVEVNATSGRGVLFGVEHANVNWPIELQAAGDGRVEVGLLPRKDTADTYNYGLTYATAETRCFWILAETARIPTRSPPRSASTSRSPRAPSRGSTTRPTSGVAPRLQDRRRQLRRAHRAEEARCRPPPTSCAWSTSTATRPAAAATAGRRRGASNHGSAAAGRRPRSTPGSSDVQGRQDALADRRRRAVEPAEDPQPDRARHQEGRLLLNDSKHTFLQVVADWGFARGETYLLRLGALVHRDA
jgi:hypothetical protein